MGRFHQYLTTVACSMGSLIFGLLNVWPSYTMKLYTDSNTTLISEPMSDVHTSLLGSLPSLGGMLGTAITSLIIDRLGRRNGGIVLTLPVLICWAIIELAKSSHMILTARFFGGISGGGALIYAPIFISEIAEDSIRGALAAGPILFYCLGVLASYILGWMCNYRTIVYINLVSCIFCTMFTALVTESPVYLLKRNKEEEALDAIATYRGASKSSKVVLEELSRLKQQLHPTVEMITVSEADPESTKNDPEKEKLNTDVVYRPKISVWKLLFVSPSSRRALTVVGLILTLQVFMGMVSVQVYAKDLFIKAAPELSSHLCSVLFALVLLSGAAFTAAFADKAGRRILQLTSCMLVAICMGALGILLQTGLAPPWVTALMVFCFCFSFSLGAGTVPYVLLTECFNSEVQGLACMILVEWVWFLNFFIIAVYPFMTTILGHHGVFYIYSCIGIANCIISYFIVPETKGLSLEQIQKKFSKS